MILLMLDNWDLLKLAFILLMLLGLGWAVHKLSESVRNTEDEPHD